MDNLHPKDIQEKEKEGRVVSIYDFALKKKRLCIGKKYICNECEEVCPRPYSKSEPMLLDKMSCSIANLV